MSNNKQSMKLYTEEQMHSAMLLALGRHGIYVPNKHYQDLIDLLTPIELPSDEEIREERLLQFPDSEYANRANDRLAFYCGAKFVINKIQGGNNEQQ
jgi:hypothetical protein